VFLDYGHEAVNAGGFMRADAHAAVQNLIEAFTGMLQQWSKYPPFG